eukprot:jgi/Undpi1/7469/HiC_scaffold_22.g09942.m1
MFNFLLQGKVGEMMAPVQSPEAQLLIAIQNRQQDKIRDLLEVKGVGANFANDRGVRPMHIACQTGDMRLVQRLLELGADIITADKAGNTPLHYASKGGYTEMVKMLVGQGAAVEKRNGSKLTAYDVATDHVVRQYLLPLQLRVNFAAPSAAAASEGASSALPSATAPPPVASVDGGGRATTPPHPGDVTAQVQSSSPVVATTANLSPGMAGLPFPGTTSSPPPPPPAAGASPQAGEGAGAVSTSAMMEPLSAGSCFPEDETPASKNEGVAGAGGARERATPPHSGAGGTPVAARPFSVVPVHVQKQEEADTAPTEPRRPDSAAGGRGDPVMTNVDLSSNFQSQVSVSGGEGSFQASEVGATLPSPPPAHPSSAPSSGRGAPPPSRPPGAYTPGPGPHQPAAEQPQGKFKPIKPDGFHSSASDKALQRRYGHTKIVRDMGAPPTAAQLGGTQGPPVGGASYPSPMGGPPPMAMPGPPPMAGQHSGEGYAQPQARSQYALPQAGYYSQQYGGAGGMQQSYGQQPFGQQQPPPGGNQHSAMPAYSRPPPNMNGGVGGDGRSALPPPGGYAYTPSGMGHAAAASPAPDNESRGGGGGGPAALRRVHLSSTRVAEVGHGGGGGGDEKSAILQSGKPVLSFPGGGIFFWVSAHVDKDASFIPWQAGAISALQERYNLSSLEFVGASAGALAATLAACDADMDLAMTLALELCDVNEIWTRPLGLAGVWGAMVEDWLDELLPDNADSICRDRVHLLMLGVWPEPGKRLAVSDFSSKEDLIKSCMASVHIPYFMNQKLTALHRESRYVDGSFRASREDLSLGASQPTVYFDYEDDVVMAERRGNFLSLTNQDGLLFMRQRGYEHVQAMVADGKLDCLREAALPSIRRKNVSERVRNR